MDLSVLDIFLLSLLDRGVQTPYELQREAGISQGASLPSLRRLVASKLASMEEGKTATNRPRHVYRLTSSGKKEARTAWKSYLNSADARLDLDSILRVVDMAAHYRADKAKIRAFLRRASAKKVLAAQQAGLAVQGTRHADKLSYSAMRARVDANRLSAEADAIHGLADLFGRSGLPEGQQPLI
jgi:DNA-binding PadR family transcriptional regulator